MAKLEGIIEMDNDWQRETDARCYLPTPEEIETLKAELKAKHMTAMLTAVGKYHPPIHNLRVMPRMSYRKGTQCEST